MDNSLRTYIDLVQTAHLAVDMQARGLLPAVDFAARAFFNFLPGLEGDCHELRSNGGSGQVEGARREVLHAVEHRPAWGAPGGISDSEQGSEPEGPENGEPSAAVRFLDSTRGSSSASKGKGSAKGQGRGKAPTRR